MSAVSPRMGAVPDRAQALLAQPERRVLQLHPAADAAAAGRVGVRRRPDELDILIPGVAGMSVMATTFNAMAYNLTFLREQGILKRLRGTPMPPASYFAGFLGNAVANAFVQVGLVVVLGHLLYDVSWPKDWVELVVFTAVGVITFGSLGIALSHAIPNFDSASAYVNAVFLPAIFISGVFYSSDSLPPGLAPRRSAAQAVIDGLGAIVTGEGLSQRAARWPCSRCGARPACSWPCGISAGSSGFDRLAGGSSPVPHRKGFPCYSPSASSCSSSP